MQLVQGIKLDMNTKTQNFQEFFKKNESGGDKCVQKEQETFEAWLRTKHGPQWDHARRFWQEVKKRVPMIATPAAIDVEGNTAQLVWSQPDVLVEVDLSDSNTIQWYARDRRLGTNDGNDEPVQDVDVALWTWLQGLGNVSAGKDEENG